MKKYCPICRRKTRQTKHKESYHKLDILGIPSDEVYFCDVRYCTEHKGEVPDRNNHRYERIISNQFPE